MEDKDIPMDARSHGDSPHSQDSLDSQPWARVVGFLATDNSSSNSTASTASCFPLTSKPSSGALFQSLHDGSSFPGADQSCPRTASALPSEQPIVDEVAAAPSPVPDISFGGWASNHSPDECETPGIFVGPTIDSTTGQSKRSQMRSTAMEIPAFRIKENVAEKPSRVIRRVPEPPMAPIAITAPAVVQMLMASQAAAAAERARIEQNAMCKRNDLQQAYAAHEKLLSLQAQAKRLEAEGAGYAHPQPRHTVRRHRSCTDNSEMELRLEWQEWYQRPHCNMAVADFCSGLEDLVVAHGGTRSAPPCHLDC